MLSRSMIRAALSVAALLTVAACASQIQTTSGKAYLDRYATQAGAQTSAQPMDAGIRAAANVEPLLRFPARLGIARIDNGRLAPIPAAESEAWLDLGRRLGPGWGEMVAISPLIAALAQQPMGGNGVSANLCGEGYSQCLEKTVRDIRLGAARQHVDAVLIYESVSRDETTSNPLAITKLALIGFFLPSEDVTAESFAQAVLLDVRNGYTYGTATADSGRPAYALSTSGNQQAVADRLRRESAVSAVVNLSDEVETMLRDLRLALAEGRAAQAESAAPK